jgi:hypothetical protein
MYSATVTADRSPWPTQSALWPSCSPCPPTFDVLARATSKPQRRRHRRDRPRQRKGLTVGTRSPDHRPRYQVQCAVSKADRGSKDRCNPAAAPLAQSECTYAERFVRSIKDECLDRMILVGEASLRRAIDEFIVHCHSERNHQGLGNELIREPDRDGTADRPVRRRQRLGGMLSFYYRAAA